MSRADVSMQSVIDGLRAEGLLSDEASARGAALMETLGGQQPWYVRAMVGFGAWLASLLLISFVVGIAAGAEGGYMAIGTVLIVGAVVLRRRSTKDFAVQMALATSLAGQALIALGLTEVIEWREPEPVFGLVCIMSAVLFFAFPDRIHRVLMVLLALGSMTALIYAWELNALIPIFGPACAAAFVMLSKMPAKLYSVGRGSLLKPLSTGLMLSAFGCLLLSAIYVLPELMDEARFQFYPRPWISTLLLGALFVYTGSDVWPRLVTGSRKPTLAIVYGLIVVLVAASWSAPGLLLALVVVMLGASTCNPVATGAGVVFLAVFLSAFFYGIELTMLTKSVILTGTGGAILLARWVLVKVLAGPVAGEVNHD